MVRRPHTYGSLLVFIFRTPEHPSGPPFRDIAGRALRLNQDPSVRARAICFRLTRHPRGHSSFAFLTLPQFQGDLV